jgi:hypothetical protein
VLVGAFPFQIGILVIVQVWAFCPNLHNDQKS